MTKLTTGLPYVAPYDPELETLLSWDDTPALSPVVQDTFDDEAWLEVLRDTQMVVKPSSEEGSHNLGCPNLSNQCDPQLLLAIERASQGREGTARTSQPFSVQVPARGYVKYNSPRKRLEFPIPKVGRKATYSSLVISHLVTLGLRTLNDLDNLPTPEDMEDVLGVYLAKHVQLTDDVESAGDQIIRHMDVDKLLNYATKRTFQNYDPNEIQKRRAEGSKGGRTSKRTPVYPWALLEAVAGLSKPKQATELGISLSAVKRMHHRRDEYQKNNPSF